jgi:acetylornithine deacetylase/succinyl-diaminopimelate desuccinylase-like protein
MLARLVASMRDDDGRILIKGFADGIVPLTEAEKRAIATVPDVDATLMREFGLGSRIGLPKSLAELITEPLLNVRGLASARVGPEATSVVPSVASASFNINIIKGMNYRNVLERIRDHVRAQGFFVTDTPPSPEVRMAHAKVAMVAMRGGAYNGVRTPLDLPISQEVIRTAESVGGPVIKLPTSGGAVPLEMIERATGSRTIIIPIANHDDNQHGFDENLRIQNLWDGIELMAALLTM